MICGGDFLEFNNEKIVYIAESTKNSAVSCPMIGHTFPDPTYNISLNPTSDYIFEFVLSGKGYLEIGENLHVLEPGMLCIIKKGVPLRCYSDEDSPPLEKIWFHMRGEMVSKVIDTMIDSDIIVTSCDISGIFFEIHDLALNGTDDDGHMMTIWCRMLEILSIGNKDKIFPAEKQDPPLNVKIKNYIDANLYTDLSLEQIAKKFEITETHVIRVFKQKYNITPMQYLGEKKMEVAKKMLSDTLMPICEIAEILRYSTPQHLSNTFKAFVGCSPSEYRKSKIR